MPPAADHAPAALTEGEVAFLFIGGAHQVYHLAPAAAELSRLLPRCLVTCLTNDAAAAEALRQVREVLHAPGMRIESIRPPLWGRMLAAWTGRRSSL